MVWNIVGGIVGGIIASLIAILIWELLRRPSLILIDPTGNAPVIQEINSQTSRAFYHLLVKNKGKTPAYSCKITMRFIHAGTGKEVFQVSGKWDRGPQPLLYTPVPERITSTGRIEASVREFPHDFLVPFAETLDVHPSMPEGFCIIVKYDGEDECYAFSTWSYLRGVGHRVPEWRLDRGEYHAIVELNYSGGNSSHTLIIRNLGNSKHDVTIGFAAVK